MCYEIGVEKKVRVSFSRDDPVLIYRDLQRIPGGINRQKALGWLDRQPPIRSRLRDVKTTFMHAKSNNVIYDDHWDTRKQACPCAGRDRCQPPEQCRH